MSRLFPAIALNLAGLTALAALASCDTGRGPPPTSGLNPGPSRTHPTPGTRNPTAPGPRGSLPDPYARPQ